jgi:hypothetical protein
MGEKRKRPFGRMILLAVVAGIIVLATGAGRKEAAPTDQDAEPRVVTARFTDPVDMEYQDSQKCIACHTKTNPINKLASPVVVTSEAGG